MRVRACLLAFVPAFVLMGATAEAKSAQDYLDDLGDYALAPLHWDAADWTQAGAAAVAISAAYSVDSRVREHFVAGGAPAGQDPHAWRDAAPLLALAAGTYAIGQLRHDAATASIGTDMAEAGALGLLSSTALKFVAGRERPNETAFRSGWREGGDGFPSGHVTAAFAVAQVFADRMPREQWGWRMLAYGLAGATAYARLDSNVHWMSDVVAGAALGVSTGRFVSERAAAGSTARIRLGVERLDRGALLTVHVRTD